MTQHGHLVAADLFRLFWEDLDVDLETPTDQAVEPVLPMD